MQRLYPPPSLTAGFIAAYAGAEPPAGWLACDGRAVKRSEYPELFAAIGTAYGVGDGSTTFNLPDLKGRVPLGAGKGSSGTTYALGAKGGEEKHALTAAEGARHRHTQGQDKYGTSVPGNQSGIALATGSIPGNALYTDYQGSGQSHNNMQPYIVVNWIISTGKEQ